LITGNPVYAHKAGVLLDRVADLYPTHDFGKQGLVNGYRDILIAIDSEDPLGLTTKSSVMQPESGLRMEGEMCFIRLSKTEKVHYMCLYGGNFISIANAEARLGEANKFSEIITY
jgi:hypothetical protein